jgi:hypothetical protein
VSTPLFAVPIVDSSRLALFLCLGTIAEGLIGVLLALLAYAHACAAVLNAWIRRDHRLGDLPGLRVSAIGGVLRLEGPQGKSAHSANCEGAVEIMTIVDRIATACVNQGGSDDQR